MEDISDLKGLVKGLIATFIDYYNDQCTSRTTPPYVIIQQDREAMLSDDFLANSKEIASMLELKIQELESFGTVRRRLETLKFLKSLIVRLNNNLCNSSKVNWNSERKGLIGALVCLYKLRDLPVDGKKSVKLFGEPFELSSTAFEMPYTRHIPFWNLIWNDKYMAGNFAQTLSANVFRPLLKDAFDIDTSTKAREPLMRESLNRLFEGYCTEEQQEESKAALSRPAKRRHAVTHYSIFSNRQVQSTLRSVSDYLGPYVPWMKRR